MQIYWLELMVLVVVFSVGVGIKHKGFFGYMSKYLKPVNPSIKPFVFKQYFEDCCRFE